MAADGINKAAGRAVSFLFLKRFFFSSIPLLFSLLFCLFPPNIYSQETGLKYIKNFSPKDYNHFPQNFSIVQDRRGIIYVGNRGGLLEYDGLSWRLISIPNNSVRSLAIDNTGTIFIGGKDEFGYLIPGKTGQLSYVSLSSELDSLKEETYRWTVHSLEDRIYFRTTTHLFRWNKGQLKEVDVDTSRDIKASFTCCGELYIRQDEIGLSKMVGNRAVNIPGGKIFGDKWIFMMVPYGAARQKILIGTCKHGLFLYDGVRAVPFATEADDYIKQNLLSHGIRLRSGDFALATLYGGMAVIDLPGNLKYIFNEDSGIQDNFVNRIFEDAQGNLWLALNNSGITKIEYPSAVSTHDKRSGLPGSVLSVTRHGPGNILYVGTTSGLFNLSPSAPGMPGQFYPVKDTPTMICSLLSTGDTLLAASYGGVLLFMDKINEYKTIIDKSSYVLLQSAKDTNRIWAGTNEGLFSLYQKNGQWKKESKIEGITRELRSIVEDNDGDLWLGTLTAGVLKVEFQNTGTITNPVIRPYSSPQYLPEGEIYTYRIAEKVVFATKSGVYRFDEKNKEFLPDSTLGTEFAGGAKKERIFPLVEDSNNNIWFNCDFRTIQAVPGPDGAFSFIKKPFLRIPPAQVNVIYPDPDGRIVWLGGDGGLVRFDKKVEKNYGFKFPPIIRQVEFNGIPRFFDTGNYKKTTKNDLLTHLPVLHYRDRNLRFEFVAPFFEDESRIVYRRQLEGYEKKWSPWTSKAAGEFYNLDSGIYAFHVQAKNTYGNLSREALFEFRILPPWTKTWWAFLIYGFMLFLLVFFLVRWRSGKLARDKRKLEQIVEERTREIEERTNEVEEKNLQLEKQTIKLKEQSEKLKEMDLVKSRFFANISHEFRTPLTLIMGPIEQMLAAAEDKEQKNELNLMLRNSQRLLTLINQLLDLSRFDSGKMKLQAGRHNIVPFLKGICASFESLAMQNKIELIVAAESEREAPAPHDVTKRYSSQEKYSQENKIFVHSNTEDISLYFDPEKLEDVMINLISNAIKFTPAGGKIFITAKETQGDGEPSPTTPAFLEISVRDTGIGIPKEQLEHIFDRFYQAAGSSGHLPGFQHKGTGIGLTLAKELVELHHGKIDVHSKEDKGTEFIVRLPMGKEHLQPGEIIESPQISFKPKRTGEISPLYTENQDNETGIAEEKEYREAGEKGNDDKNVILVVEDNAEVRQYIRGPLKALYQVEEAVNGRQGIDMAKKIIPDLIISDIMMPEVDGYELCRVLKKDIKTSHIPVIMLTAKASEASIIQGLETGADDYITKPFSTRILSSRIRNLIDLRRQLQQKIQRELVLQPAEIAVSSIDRQFIQELQDTIEKYISDTLFGVEQLGKKLYMSRASLYRKIFALTGESPREFIKSYRLKRGAQLLKANFGNVTEVAFEVGFSSTSYFIKCFKEKFQRSPHTFQAAESSTESKGS